MNERMWMFEDCVIRRVCADESAPVLYLFSPPDVMKAFAQSGWTVVLITLVGWERDLTPWPAKAVFRDQPDFSGGARKFLRLMEEKIFPAVEEDLQPAARIIAGYSLAGLFSVFAALEARLFDAAASVSGSIWYPGFADYVNQMDASPRMAYFSVGDRERMGRNAAFHSIEEDTKRVAKILNGRGTRTVFETNRGGHFDDLEGRMLRALEWIRDQFERG